MLTRYLFYLFEAITNDAIFVNFSVCLNMKNKPSVITPKFDNSLYFLSDILFCENLESVVLILLYWPSNTLSLCAFSFRTNSRKLTFHVTFYLSLLTIFVCIVDSIFKKTFIW